MLSLALATSLFSDLVSGQSVLEVPAVVVADLGGDRDQRTNDEEDSQGN